MESELTLLENYLVNQIVNNTSYDNLKLQISYLKVKSRENTRVGQYVNFIIYPPFDLILKEKEMKNSVISIPKLLKLNNVHTEFSFELNITNGQIDFLEIIGNGEHWNNNYSSYELVEW